MPKDMVRISVSLTDGEFGRFHERCEREGTTHAAAVRALIDRWLDEAPQREAEERRRAAERAKSGIEQA